MVYFDNMRCDNIRIGNVSCCSKDNCGGVMDATGTRLLIYIGVLLSCILCLPAYIYKNAFEAWI